MSLSTRLQVMLKSATRRGRMEREMDDELKFHIASYTDDLVRSGISREQAERMAQVEFGRPELVKEDCRQALGLRLLDETRQDLRYAARMFRKSPGFAAIAVITLAAGIGMNTAIFSIVNAWVLKPLPFVEPDQLTVIWSTDSRNARRGTTPADLYSWRQERTLFSHICGWTIPLFTFMHGNEPQQVRGARVNADFFEMLGATPKLGRSFSPQEDEPGAEAVAMLSDGFWRDMFGADPNLVGRTIEIDGRKTTVVGILPADFQVTLLGRISIWMPLALTSAERANRDIRMLNVIARLKPGSTLARASQYLKTEARQLEKAYPATNTGRGVLLKSMQEEMGEHTGREPTLIVFALVGCVLLIACANVANLVVGRALRRQQEMAVRLAIGAGRLRLLRQLLVENLLLFVTAAGASVLLAMWGVRWIQDSISYENRGFLPNFGSLHLDLTVLLYTFGIAFMTGVIFGFAPAVHCWRVDVNHGLKGTSSRTSDGPAGARLKNVLVVFEMSLAVVVLVVSGLLVNGMVQMYAGDPGFKVQGVVTARIVLSDTKYTNQQRAQRFFIDLIERVKRMPEVKAAGAAQFVPYDGSMSVIQYVADGQPVPKPSEIPRTILDVVSPDYFNAIGIPLVRGRLLSERDTANTDLVGIINQSMARREWPDVDPIGRRVRVGAKLDRVVTIAGVVKDTKGQNETDTPEPELFVSQRQFGARAMTLVIRQAANTNEIAGALGNIVRSIDPGQAVFSVRTLEDLRADQFNPRRVVGQVMTLFGAISVFLAATGIYGVMAYAVAARRKEFGIRVALGAGRGDVLSLVAAQGLKLTGIGLVIGLGSAFGATRFMKSLFYQVSPTDPPTFALTTLLMLLVAMLACYLPARYASRVDPIRALHHE